MGARLERTPGPAGLLGTIKRYRPVCLESWKGTGREGIMRFEEPDEGGSRGELTLHPRVREKATRCPAQNMGGTGLVVLQTRTGG